MLTPEIGGRRAVTHAFVVVPTTECGKMKNASKVVVAALILAAVFVLGCAPKPASIEITPSDVVVNSADEAPALAAKILDEKGQEVPDVKAAWSSSAPEVAEVDAATGALTIKASGKAEITAAAGEVKSTVAVTVALYKSLKADAEALALKVGEVKPVAAKILDEKDQPIEGEIVWATADEKIATVGPKGEITGVAAGATVVTGTAKALKVEVKVDVQAVGPAELKAAKAEVQLKVGKTEKVEVQTLGADGQPATGFTVAFASADAAVATVAEDGTITAVAAGETTVTATSGDKSAPIKVVVK
jgi:uncharacterized protein YjdB